MAGSGDYDKAVALEKRAIELADPSLRFSMERVLKKMEAAAADAERTTKP